MVRTGSRSVRSFHNDRGKILFWLPLGGLGDVLMQRMLFWDAQRIFPEAEIHFACHGPYCDAVRDHPCVKRVLPSSEVNLEDYMMHWRTCVVPANKYEDYHGIDCRLHRSDIWGLYCGYEITNHDMHFRLDPTLLARCREWMQSRKKFPEAPSVLLAPISAVKTKSLTAEQIMAVVDATEGMNLFGCHKKELKLLSEIGLPGVYDRSILEWMHFVAASDYVVSVDSAAFHMAGGLRKPLVGIFTFANGKTYGKYFDFVLLQKHRDDGGWDCGPCYNYKACPKEHGEIKPCLTEISPAMIRRAVGKMLERWPVRGRRIALPGA